MQLSELIDQEVTFTKKNFIGPVPVFEIKGVVVKITEFSVKCLLKSGHIYVPKKFFTREAADIEKRIFPMPPWFSFATREECDMQMKKLKATSL